MRRGDVMTIGGLLVFLVAAAVLAPRAARLLPREAPEADAFGPQPAASPAAGASATPTPAEVKINVKLYFEDALEPSLAAEDREIAYSADLSRQVQTVVEELIKGSAEGHLAPLPSETRVLGVFVAARGTAFVDLSKEAASGGGAGSAAERLAVYAVVDTITANFPAIRRVQILLNDRPVETLLGHIDLSRPLPPDMTLVAAKPAPVEPNGEPADGAAEPVAPGGAPEPAFPRPSPLARPSLGSQGPASRSQ